MAQKLLIVDDNPYDREIMIATLDELGWKEEVDLAQSGDVALQHLRGNDLPALIFMDLEPPGEGGVKTLREIRADEHLSHIPVIIVSGSDNPRDKEEALTAGADDYLCKAVDFDKFGHDVSSVLRCFLKEQIIETTDAPE